MGWRWACLLSGGRLEGRVYMDGMMERVARGSVRDDTWTMSLVDHRCEDERIEERG